mmetsp:Transcript_13604/g.16199  ORF Transcript_13604/g.16199 Transcript_13604/m.16199 type:complete len:207 (-) Transcript_13604:238-858(-)
MRPSIKLNVSRSKPISLSLLLLHNSTSGFIRTSSVSPASVLFPRALKSVSSAFLSKVSWTAEVTSRNTSDLILLKLATSSLMDNCCRPLLRKCSITPQIEVPVSPNNSTNELTYTLILSNTKTSGPPVPFSMDSIFSSFSRMVVWMDQRSSIKSFMKLGSFSALSHESSSAAASSSIISSSTLRAFSKMSADTSCTTISFFTTLLS